MKRYYDEYLGYYIPAFFFMELNTDEELYNLNTVSTETLSTFHHEYVHFLQDITTSYGLMNISHVVDIQKTINEKILKSKDKKFKLPIIIENDEISGINIDLLSLYYGDYDLHCKAFEKIESITPKENGLIPNFEKIPSIKVTVQSNYHRFNFSFGAVCLLESMAFLIEEQLFDNVTPPQFPYKTAEQVCKFIYPDIKIEKRNVIYLCDAALNAYHPGQFFYDVLYKMKEKKIFPKTPKDIYSFVEDYKFQNKKKQYDIMGLFRVTSSIAEKQISDYFTIPHFDSVSRWSKEIITSARNIRLNNFSFWSKILDQDTKQKRRYEFMKFVRELGFPLITNNKNQYFFHHPKIETDNKIISLKAINEIKNILSGKQIKCTMKDFCKISPDGDITNDKCDKSPWSRVFDERLCPFAQIWRMWGLREKEPIV